MRRKQDKKRIRIQIGDFIDYGLYRNLEVVGETENGLSYILQDRGGVTQSFFKKLVERNSVVVKPSVSFADRKGKTIYQRLRVKRYSDEDIQGLNESDYNSFIGLFNLKFDRLVEMGRCSEIDRVKSLQEWSDILSDYILYDCDILFVHMTDDRELDILGVVELDFNSFGIQTSYRLEEVYASKCADFEVAVETLKAYLVSIFADMDSTTFKYFTYEKENHISDSILTTHMSKENTKK